MLDELKLVMAEVKKRFANVGEGNLGIGSTIFAVKPGDGSAREQAASCQKVLGGWANIACEYATKRYRSNLINWGMLPLLQRKITPHFLLRTEITFLCRIFEGRWRTKQMKSKPMLWTAVSER